MKSSAMPQPEVIEKEYAFMGNDIKRFVYGPNDVI